MQAQRQGREVVGLFADQGPFEAAINALLGSGFEHADLSVLASHDSLEAATMSQPRWQDRLTALVGELRYEGPLVASGAILLAGGATAAWLAGVIAATVGGLALKELLGEATATPHTDHFARSLAAGSLILWVRADVPEREEAARSILAAHGASNIHCVPPAGASSTSREQGGPGEHPNG
ncbi:MAG: hypothetical protein WAS73_12530 [Defluviicoccus sp.]